MSHDTGHPENLAMSRNVRKKFKSQTGHPKKWLCSNPFEKSRTLTFFLEEKKLEYWIFKGFEQKNQIFQKSKKLDT